MATGRFAFKQAFHQWNLHADKLHRIRDESGYESLKAECRTAHAETGRREIEMKSHQSRYGHAILISF